MVMNTTKKTCCVDCVRFSPVHSNDLLYIYALEAEMSSVLQGSNIPQSTIHWASLDLSGHRNIQMDRSDNPLC